MTEDAYRLSWVGFGDQPAVARVTGPGGLVLKDSAVNVFGAEVTITRMDGRSFYFESLNAAGVAAGADAIRVTYGSGAGAEIQVINPTNTDFATYAASSPDHLASRIALNIVSTSTDLGASPLP